MLLLALCTAGCRVTRIAHSPSRPAPMAGAKMGQTTNGVFVAMLPASLGAEPKTHPKWNPVWWFGNVDDPEAPPDYIPGAKHRRAKWYCRNSLHNFTFYVIGVADQEFDRVGAHPGEVFNPRDGWNWAVTQHGCWQLPFVSYKRKGFMCYCGWRERGNFGLKLNF